MAYFVDGDNFFTNNSKITGPAPLCVSVGPGCYQAPVTIIMSHSVRITISRLKIPILQTSKPATCFLNSIKAVSASFKNTSSCRNVSRLYNTVLCEMILVPSALRVDPEMHVESSDSESHFSMVQDKPPYLCAYLSTE